MAVVLVGLAGLSRPVSAQCSGDPVQVLTDAARAAYAAGGAAASAPGTNISPALARRATELANAAAEAEAMPDPGAPGYDPQARRNFYQRQATFPQQSAADVKASPEYAALDPGTQRAVDALLERAAFTRDRVTLRATANLAELVASGRLQTPEGRALLTQLGSAAGGSDVESAEAMFLLSNRRAIDGALSGAAVTPTAWDSERILGTAGPISEVVSSQLRNTNHPWRPGRRLGSVAHTLRVLAPGGDPINGVRSRANARAPDPGRVTSAGALESRDRALRYSRAVVDEAMSAGWGNCAENARVAAVFLHDAGVPGVEVMMREGTGNGDEGTHAFVVVGRDPASDPVRPESWGPNAVIVDPWSGNPPFRVADRVGDSTFWNVLPGAGGIEYQFRLPDPQPSAGTTSTAAAMNDCGQNNGRQSNTLGASIPDGRQAGRAGGAAGAGLRR